MTYPCTDCGKPTMGMRCDDCRVPSRTVKRRRVAENVILFELPYPPDVGNARGHWRVRERVKAKYWADCDLWTALDEVPAMPWQRVRMRAVFHGWNRLDPDNAMARTKYVTDFLRSRGYLVDDRTKNIEWDGLPAQNIDRKNQRLELYVEPIA